MAVRVVKTSVDTTMVDAFTMSKARQEQRRSAAESEYTPMSESIRSKGGVMWIVDFFTIRQPGFNIALLIVAAADVVLVSQVDPIWRHPLTWFVAGYGVVFCL